MVPMISTFHYLTISHYTKTQKIKEPFKYNQVMNIAL